MGVKDRLYQWGGERTPRRIGFFVLLALGLLGLTACGGPVESTGTSNNFQATIDVLNTEIADLEQFKEKRDMVAEKTMTPLEYYDWGKINSEVRQRSVLLMLKDIEGKISLGSGSVFESKEGRTEIVTAGHMFHYGQEGDYKMVVLPFAAVGDGILLQDIFDGKYPWRSVSDLGLSDVFDIAAFSVDATDGFLPEMDRPKVVSSGARVVSQCGKYQAVGYLSDDTKVVATPFEFLGSAVVRDGGYWALDGLSAYDVNNGHSGEALICVDPDSVENLGVTGFLSGFPTDKSAEDEYVLFSPAAEVFELVDGE